MGYYIINKGRGTAKPGTTTQGDNMKTWNVTVRTWEPNEIGCFYTTVSVEARNAGDAMMKAAEKLENDAICGYNVDLVEPAEL